MKSYKSEEEFIDIVERCLKNNGCKTWREIVPDSCESWSMPWRADLIFFREDFGYIGIEGKNIRTLGQGGVISDAVDQIENKYRKQTYLKGNMIGKWGILVPMECGYLQKDNVLATNMVKTFLRNFLRKRYNICLLEYSPSSKWRNEGVTFDAMTPNCIKIGGENTYGES